MRFLRCVHAEFLLVAPRLIRTRLGIAMLGLGLSLVWLRGHGFDPLTLVLQAGALGACVASSGLAGHAADRATLTTALTHPTSSLAIATGRWVAIVAPAAVLALACTAVLGGTVAVLAAGLFTAAAVGSCALAFVLPLRQSGALALFLSMAIAGTVAPERLVDLARPDVLRLTAAGVLELGPALWHYRDITRGDWRAVAHAIAWSGFGILVAGLYVGRRRAS